MSLKSNFVRGHRFERIGDVPLSQLGSLYLIFRAIDGDELAAEILNSFEKIVRDADGNQIWPVVVK